MPTYHQRFDALYMEDLLDRVYTDQPSIVGDAIIIEQGLCILAGAQKTGKSLLTMNLAIACATGTPWLGFPTYACRVLVVQAEVPERRLQERAKIMREGALAWPDPEVLAFMTDRTLALDQPQGLKILRQIVEDLQPRLLIIDPLSQFFTGDENSAKDMNRLLKGVGELIQMCGVAVMLVHHTAKPGQDSRRGGHQLRGSSALSAGPDTNLVLHALKGSWKLEFELRHEESREPLTLYRTEHLWYTADPAQDPSLTPVYEILEERGILPSKSLREALMAQLGVSQATAERRMKDALAVGLVTVKSGFYSASKKGPKPDEPTISGFSAPPSHHQAPFSGRDGGNSWDNYVEYNDDPT